MRKTRWMNTIALAAVLLAELLTNVLPLGGSTAAQISEKFPDLLTPASYTFSIWWLIYLLMIGFVVYQWIAREENPEAGPAWARLSAWFFLSCLAAIARILARYSAAVRVSAAATLFLTVCLVMIVRCVPETKTQGAGRLIMNAGFDLYLGWSIAAAIASISVLLTALGWKDFGLSPEFRTVLLLSAGAGIALWAISRGHRYFLPDAILWAYVGILVKHFSASGWNAAYPYAISAAIAGIVVILCAQGAFLCRVCGCRNVKPAGKDAQWSGDE